MQQNFFELDESYVGGGLGTIDPSSFYTMADETDTLTLPVDGDLSDLHEDGLAASTEAFTLSLTLMNYRNKIVAQNGLGMVEVVGIESHVPGLLQHKAPTKYTYELSTTNLEWSLEAIDSKIKKFMTAANAFFMRIITTIRTRAEGVVNRIRKGNMLKRLQAMQTAMRSKATIIGFEEAVNYLGGEAQFLAHFKRSANVELFNNTFHTDLSVEDMKRIGRGGSVTDIINILAGKSGQAAADYTNLSALDGRFKNAWALMALLKNRLDAAKMLFDPRFEDKAGDRAYIDDYMEIPEMVDLSQIGKTLNTRPDDYTKYMDKLEFFGKKIAELEAGMKQLDGYVSKDYDNVVESYRKWRAGFETNLMELDKQMKYIALCITHNSVAISTIASVMTCMSRGALTRGKEQFKGETTV